GLVTPVPPCADILFTILFARNRSVSKVLTLYATLSITCEMIFSCSTVNSRCIVAAADLWQSRERTRPITGGSAWQVHSSSSASKQTLRFLAKYDGQSFRTPTACSGVCWRGLRSGRWCGWLSAHLKQSTPII